MSLVCNASYCCLVAVLSVMPMTRTDGRTHHKTKVKINEHKLKLDQAPSKDTTPEDQLVGQLGT